MAAQDSGFETSARAYFFDAVAPTVRFLWLAF